MCRAFPNVSRSLWGVKGRCACFSFCISVGHMAGAGFPYSQCGGYDRCAGFPVYIGVGDVGRGAVFPLYTMWKAMADVPGFRSIPV
jgi:hypothetical protein